MKNTHKLQNLEGQYGHLEGRYGHFTKKRVIFVVLFQGFDFDPLVLYCTNIVALEQILKPSKAMYQTPLFTKQEFKILQLLAQGQTNKEIADGLNLSTHTIKNHKANMKGKLDITHTCQLMCYAVEYIKKYTDESNGGGNALIIRYLTIKPTTIGYMSV